MSIDERIDRLTLNLELLAGKVNALAATVVVHDDRFEKLIVISERNAANWERLERQWQAYLNTLPRQ